VRRGCSEPGRKGLPAKSLDREVLEALAARDGGRQPLGLQPAPRPGVARVVAVFHGNRPGRVATLLRLSLRPEVGRCQAVGRHEVLDLRQGSGALLGAGAIDLAIQALLFTDELFKTRHQ
jgi:hypothetical protein